MPPRLARRPGTLLLVGVFLVVLVAGPAGADQSQGQAALQEFLAWKSLPAHSSLQFREAVSKYREKLKAEGSSDSAADRMIRIILAHHEAELYNRVYAGPAEFNTRPNQLLVEAVDGVQPGTALDVGMGQGRNSVYLASKGWRVTGFDVAEVGLEKARQEAARLGLKIDTVHASDDEFDFGDERWDLIAIIYALEKRSVQRVRDALKPGGLIVVEAGHSDTSGAPFEFDSNELLELFKGFRILRYEDRAGTYDWGPETIRLVRFVAQKPLASAEVTHPLPASVATDRHVTVKDVSLHYVDWGGTGEALVFLPPACQTAHIFGDIAPMWCTPMSPLDWSSGWRRPSGPPSAGTPMNRSICTRAIDAVRPFDSALPRQREGACVEWVTSASVGTATVGRLWRAPLPL